ncbi:MAG: exodeoxyribonuclease V subunit gamma, partial [Burkholderiales bacterium]|nr:exodeoxyribonuclease V subunit gamma [Burkholderiales bacterium]
MPSPVPPGFLILHGNRLELLGRAVFDWLAANPLQVLEDEVFLVQNNGMAEWVKMSLAAQAGICAATRVELPGRFLWRAYRQVLGPAAVPGQSALDKEPLCWRLMALLPALAARPGFEPLLRFLERGGPERRLQLARALADLFDQYQVYRADWLAAWAAGRDTLPRPDARAATLPPDQAWQAALWRELLAPNPSPAGAGAGVGVTEPGVSRAELHRRFIDALESGAAPAAALPRRIVVFGMTHLPLQTLEALAALGRHSQVLLTVLNPCRYHWADILEGRELLRAGRRRRLPLREGRDLSALGLEQMHAHAHPLLAAWGRQARDFVRQLDRFDETAAARHGLELPRVDLFDDTPPASLLQQVQAAIRDLLPLAEHDRPAVAEADRSIVFHIGHSAQREVEILHDQLLELLAAPAGEGARALAPRDIVVMVPDIEAFTPAIRSVFGQYERGDARHIPFDIADLAAVGHNPLLAAFDWLLRLPAERCSQSEMRDLLEVPALARRFGLEAEDLPRLARWIDGAGIRWGLDAAQREALGLGACGEINTWVFGLRRMLLGYAGGAAPAFAGIEPYPEVGGLEAALAGSLAALFAALERWAALARSSAAPREWLRRLRELAEAFAAPGDEFERLSLAAFSGAAQRWAEACESGGFDEALPLAVVREAVVATLDEPGAGRRFRAGGVTFCTLLPMRAIPFEVVCLLGMNEGEYPRAGRRSDFDLMVLPGQARAGDRSRRDDDRELMLEALLSARRTLYVSWTGRSQRDNSAQPPSVLVSQLRDYLAAGWGQAVVGARTTEHPLQPFSRRYFEAQVEPRRDRGAGGARPALFTHAREWRDAHAPAAASAAEPLPPFVPDPGLALTIAALARFLKNPVREFFRRRLDVVYREEDEAGADDETFALDGLEQYGMLDEAMHRVLETPGAEADLEARVQAQIERLRGAGRLPLAATGRRSEQELRASLLPVLAAWAEQQAG